jgi:hypothetical protein
MKFNISIVLKNLLIKFKFHWSWTRVMGTLHEDKYTFLIISHSVLLRMRNALDKSCRENQTHVLYSITFFKKYYAIYEIMWKNIVEPGRPQMIIWHMHSACWVFKSTNTHSVCVTLIDFLLKQWLHECASILCYTYVACLVCFGWKGFTYDIKNAEMSKCTHYQWWWSFLTVSIITVIIYANKIVSALSFVALWSVSTVSESQMRKELTLPSICMWYN